MRKLLLSLVVTLSLVLVGCGNSEPSQDAKDSKQARAQQGQYAKSQPVPSYDFSIERHLVIELYNARNLKASTHSVWRGETSVIEGDCLSVGFGIPYDTSLTNPLKVETKGHSYGYAITEQAEPNGIFASKNTSATWVLCVGENGNIDPVYVESKVNVFPYPVNIDYKTNRVTKAGKSTVSIKL